MNDAKNGATNCPKFACDSCGVSIVVGDVLTQGELLQVQCRGQLIRLVKDSTPTEPAATLVDIVITMTIVINRRLQAPGNYTSGVRSAA